MGPMDPLAYSNARPFKWKRNRTPLSQEVRNTYRVLTITLTLLAIVTTSTYLYVNSLKSVKGYELEQLQSDYETLQSDLRKLERKVIEAQSFLHLKTEEHLDEMEAAETETYTFVEESNLADMASGNAFTQ